MSPEAAELLRKRAKIELARKSLWHYCQLQTPGFYLQDRTYLHEMADTIQKFIETPGAHFLVISAPPRHGKTLTAQHASEWCLGRNPHTTIITGSYNEILSQQFSKAVRNAIGEQKADANRLVFSDVFPGVNIKRGDASAKLWGIDGSSTTNYLATSPGGTATGIGKVSHSGRHDQEPGRSIQRQDAGQHLALVYKQPDATHRGQRLQNHRHCDQVGKGRPFRTNSRQLPRRTGNQDASRPQAGRNARQPNLKLAGLPTQDAGDEPGHR